MCTDVVYSENWPEVDSADLTILTALLSSLPFWSTLHPATASPHSGPVSQLCPFSAASFGQGQPQVRQTTWALVGSLIRVLKGSFRLLVCIFAECLRFAFSSSWKFILGVSECDMHRATCVSLKPAAHIHAFVVHS